MDRGRAQAVSIRIGESRERRLERNFKEFRQDSYAYTSRKPRPEILPPPQQPQAPPSPI